MRPILQARVSSVAGPTHAWLLPQLGMSIRPVSVPIREPPTKLGGQPVWLDEPFWPVLA